MTLFLPLQYPGPQLSDEDVMELDLFCLYVTDKVLEHFVEATNDYAEAQKASKPAMYLRFKKSPFTKLWSTPVHWSTFAAEHQLGAQLSKGMGPEEYE